MRRGAAGLFARGLRRTTRLVVERPAVVLRATVFLAAGFLVAVFFATGRRTVVFRAIVARARVPVVRAVGRRLATVRGSRAVVVFLRATDANRLAPQFSLTRASGRPGNNVIRRIGNSAALTKRNDCSQFK